MLPILFLDIDDVLCMNERYGGLDIRLALNGQMAHPDKVLRQAFNREACKVLAQLHAAMDARLRYVISSTWREALSREQLSRLFLANGLACVTESLHPDWHTPIELFRQSRAEDIANWLSLNHEGEPLAILDDSFSGESLKVCLKDPRDPFHGRVVLCRERVGLRAEHLEPLLRALRTPATPWERL